MLLTILALACAVQADTYTVSISVSMGASKTNLTLNAKLIGTDGNQDGNTRTAGFVEIGKGNYLLTDPNVPCGFRGVVEVYDANDPNTVAVCPLNPEEVEYVDENISSRSSHSAADVASLVLADPNYPLLTDPNGHVTATGGGDGNAPTVAEIAAGILADPNYPLLTDPNGWVTAWVAGGGAVQVDHDYGGIDNLRYVDGGQGVDDGIVRAFLTSEYEAENYLKRGETTTVNGRWVAPMMLMPGNYTLVFSKPGVLPETTREITVE
jgi:hypothetical protein